MKKQQLQKLEWNNNIWFEWRSRHNNRSLNEIVATDLNEKATTIETWMK
jgi:hypothetical protein